MQLQTFRPLTRWCATLALLAGLAACGGGNEIPNFGNGGTASLPDGTATVTVTGPGRVVADTIYSYSASLSSGVANAVNWIWGDGSANGVGATVDKVWNKPGSFAGTLSASLGGKTLSASQNAVVVGKPISGGFEHTCALKPDGTVGCWGSNGSGELGDGTLLGKTTTVAVTGLTDAVGLGLSSAHSCALKSNGAVVCWGLNNTAQLGDGTTVGKTAPVAVTGLSDATSIAVGTYHSCAIKANRSVVCWGLNSFGQIGNGASGFGLLQNTITAVTGLTDAVSIAVGGLHSCAVKANGSVVCWGKNDSGQLGDGTYDDKTTTVAVTGLTDAVSLSAGGLHTCALKTNKTVVCWGANNYGQLGDGTTVFKTTTTVVTGLADVIHITSGQSHSCALKANGAVACWGFNGQGQMGNGSTTPTAVTSTFNLTTLSDVKAVAAGLFHTCALKNDGSLACWGGNFSGQLGDGTSGSAADKSVPTAVLGGAIFWK
jgi:alpha-tubulin suppressor-like RCC1 family protein